jgi:hypothetical protein
LVRVKGAAMIDGWVDGWMDGWMDGCDKVNRNC